MEMVQESKALSSTSFPFALQVEMDRRLGFHYVGYHSYGKRRYFELLSGKRSPIG